MKKITMLSFALLMTLFTNAQFVTNPNFDDGPTGTITEDVVKDGWTYDLIGTITTPPVVSNDQDGFTVAGQSLKIVTVGPIASGVTAVKVINNEYSFDYPTAGHDIKIVVKAWVKSSYAFSDKTDIKFERIINGNSTSAAGTPSTTTPFNTLNTWEEVSKTRTEVGASLMGTNTIQVLFQIGKLGTGTTTSQNTYIDDITTELYVDGNLLSTNRIIKDDSALSLYPNPTSDVLNFRVPTNKTIKHITVHNLLGQKVLESSNTEQINVRTLNTGMYILKLEMEDGLTSTKRFMVK